MRVLSIGTDRKLFEEGSLVRERQIAYAAKIGNIDTIVFTRNTKVPVKVGTLSITPTNSASRLFYGLDAWRVARNLPKPDVITTQDPFETGIIALFISYRLKTPLHVQVHTDFTTPEFSRHSLLNWIRQKMAWFVLRRASRIRVLLERTAKDIREGGVHAPITVLPIFVDTKRYASLSHTKHPRWKLNILCVGRFEKEKRFELAVDALALARNRGHDVGLTMVGDGRLRRRYYHHAQRLQVADRLEMVGWHNDLGKYYAEADLVLVPSRFEGYGLVIVEALSAGVPVLATDVGVASEAGAIISRWQDFSEAVVQWIESGPRTAHLTVQPYKDLNDYVEKYCADVAATGTAVV